MGLRRTERSYHLLVTRYRIEILPAQDQPAHFLGLGISTVNPRSRDLALSLFHPSTTLTLPSTFINLVHFQTSIHQDSHSNLRISLFSHSTSQKCLPKLLRRSPPLVARPQLARHL